MMITMIVAVAAALMTSAIQIQTVVISRVMNTHRHQVMSSRERCPLLKPLVNCEFEILARRGGQWDICDETHQPSGADLPMRRWFLIEGHCHYRWGLLQYKIILPPQKVLR